MAVNLAKVIVVGSCIIDLAMIVDRFPRPGESLVSSELTAQVGGNASNQAVAAVRLGAVTRLISRLGADPWADLAHELWRKETIDSMFVGQDPDQPTGMGVVITDKDGQNITISHPAANSFLSPDDIAPFWPEADSRMVLLTNANAPFSTIEYLLMNAGEAGMKTILSVSPAENFPLRLFPLVDVAILNEFEATQVTGIEIVNDEAAHSAADYLVKSGATAAIITRGSRGCVVASPGESFLVPAFKVAPIDSTGAGDSFCAALSVHLASDNSLPSAARFASAAAAICVTRQGTWQSMPTRDEVERFLKQRPTEATAISWLKLQSYQS